MGTLVTEKAVTLLSSLGRLIQATKPYRSRFGLLRGLLLWFNLRRHLNAGLGTLHKVWMPGYRHPVFLRAQTTDVLVFTQIFVKEELGFEIPNLPSSIVDAGANIGLASLFFAHSFPHAKIIALEVEESNFELLRMNTKQYPNITCLRKALWSSPKRLRIVNPKDEPWAFRGE